MLSVLSVFFFFFCGSFILFAAVRLLNTYILFIYFNSIQNNKLRQNFKRF
jgi:hypothetical protein